MASLRRSLANTGTDTAHGFHWDEAIVYAPRSKWEDSPTPLLWRGPVYRSISGLAAALTETSRAKLPEQGTEAPPDGNLCQSEAIRPPNGSVQLAASQYRHEPAFEPGPRIVSSDWPDRTIRRRWRFALLLRESAASGVRIPGPATGLACRNC